MKKILIFSASPRRRGNSDRLCDAFSQGAVEAGHQVEKIFLRDKSIHYCLGCGVCNTTHQCVQKDDMQDILNKMVEADVLVFATPVYFYTMNAQMKTLIDRTTPRYTDISHKEVYFLLAAADTDRSSLQRTLESFRGFTEDCLEDTKEKGIVYGTGVWQVGEIEHSPALEEAYQMGKRA